MTDIETFLSDFREMAESLKHFRVELIWCEPETGEFVYTYSWCVMLGTFNIEREDGRHIYRQLKDFDYWKLCLNVSIEALFDTGNSTDTPAFCEELKNSVQEMQRDTEKISDGEACIQTKRKFIGIEINPDYFKIAEARIQKAVSNFQNVIDFSEDYATT